MSWEDSTEAQGCGWMTHTCLVKTLQVCQDIGCPDLDYSCLMVAPKLLHLLAGAIGAVARQPAEHAVLLGVPQIGPCQLESEPQAAVVRSHLLLPVPEAAAGRVPATKRDMPEGLPGLRLGVVLGVGHLSVYAACWYPVAQTAGCCVLGWFACSGHARSTVQGSWL